jgi:hypothetical protein
MHGTDLWLRPRLLPSRIAWHALRDDLPRSTLPLLPSAGVRQRGPPLPLRQSRPPQLLENWSLPSKIVPFIPASKVSLVIAGKTITRNAARRLRLAASSPALEKHIVAKNGWNDWIFHSAAWDAQTQALGALEHAQELFVVKWAHNLLPAQHHVKRIGQAKSGLCPSCPVTIKTAPHIFACEQRVEWQATFLASLRKLLAKPRTQPDLQRRSWSASKVLSKTTPFSTCPPTSANRASRC